MSSCSEIDQLVGARVRSLRQKMGMSQSDLGKVVGVTFQQVQKYENGTNRIGASRLVRIAAALDVQPGYFFERPEIRTSEPLLFGALHQDIISLVEVFRLVPEASVRKSVIDIVRLLATAKR